MPRKRHIWFPYVIMHVTARGNHKNAIFKEDRDYRIYLNYLQEALRYYNHKYHIIAYALMTNHIHMEVETEDKDISELMMRLNGRYAQYFNNRYKYAGHLFQGRYKSEIIYDNKYLLDASRYIHLNPVRAKIVTKPEDYKWSSYAMYIGKVKENIVRSQKILSYFNRENSAKNCRELYKEFVEGL